MNLDHGNDSDHEEESNSEIDFETDRETEPGSSHEDTIHVRSLESDCDSINEGDFGHNILNDDDESSSDIYHGNYEMGCQNDHEIILDGIHHNNASQEVHTHCSLTPESSNSVEEAPVNNVPSLIHITFPPPVSTLSANNLSNIGGIGDTSSSVTCLMTEVQDRLEVEQESPQACGIPHVEATPRTQAVDIPLNTASIQIGGDGGNDEKLQSLARAITSVAEKLQYLQSLHSELVVHEEQRHTVLLRQEELRDKWNNILQQASVPFEPKVKHRLKYNVNATELSRFYSDIGSLVIKRRREEENLRVIEAKRAKLDTEITKVIIEQAGAVMDSSTQQGTAHRTPPDDEEI
ncbi:hypothetical protein ColTof3_11516 [Colletotrichum tofieldiae]|nr:hypothetical protein ColTof3_11516 [Colletotrichum tofieldiae]